MPIFEYRCRDCGHVTEFLEKADSRRKHACGACGSAATEKALSTFAAHSQPAGPACASRGTCTSGQCPLS